MFETNLNPRFKRPNSLLQLIINFYLIIKFLLFFLIRHHYIMIIIINLMMTKLHLSLQQERTDLFIILDRTPKL